MLDRVEEEKTRRITIEISEEIYRYIKAQADLDRKTMARFIQDCVVEFHKLDNSSKT